MGIEAKLLLTAAVLGLTACSDNQLSAIHPTPSTNFTEPIDLQQVDLSRNSVAVDLGSNTVLSLEGIDKLPFNVAVSLSGVARFRELVAQEQGLPPAVKINIKLQGASGNGCLGGITRIDSLDNVLIGSNLISQVAWKIWPVIHEAGLIADGHLTYEEYETVADLLTNQTQFFLWHESSHWQHMFAQVPREEAEKTAVASEFEMNPESIFIVFYALTEEELTDRFNIADLDPYKIFSSLIGYDLPLVCEVPNWGEGNYVFPPVATVEP